MGTQLDAFPFQEPRTQQDIISSWLDLDDAYTPIFQQELQDLENHLFQFETDPVSSSLPVPEESPFMFDLYNFNAEQAGLEQNEAYQPILPVEQCVQQDVCDTFLNDYELGSMSSPTDLSPDSNNNINDQFCDDTTISGFMNQLGDVEMSEPIVTPANTTDSNKTDDEDNEDGTDEDRPKPGTLNCKNLVSERNRRKRLSQQLLSLRAIVPNITKMDKRSVLVDALSYLRNIHEETEKLQKDLKAQQPRPKLSDLRESSQDNPSGTLRIPRTSVALPKPRAQITEIDTEKIEDKRFVVKITCKGGNGVGTDILRVFESLDFEITYTALQQLQPQEVLVTIFVRVRKQGKMTEQKLKDCITSMALRTGLSLQNP
ncbi:hypothetical protein AQUCO_00100352v1 [Aquilegia coerulea]|uniref:BHLH domain-containing protein n=1 Tax=Aquilegia coerulea TaxID=218851 RepID=A0A2G5FA01_AQUCA|nr:hypothetical protein AQUCO_00100352v1 [Aquilegia coerulea]